MLCHAMLSNTPRKISSFSGNEGSLIGGSEI